MMLYRHYRLLPLLALTLGIWMPNVASAQGNQPALPLLHVLGSAKNSVAGLTPAQIKRAYGFDQINNEGKGQTIGIIDAFDHPNVEQDLAKFDKQFGLPDCTTGNGCFQKVFACGSSACNTNPGTNDPNYSFWALEIATDVEWAHAIAPKANIVLVEVAAGTLDILLDGVDVAVKPPYSANVVSMSWGGTEFSGETGAEDNHFIVPKRNVTFFAGAGDLGHGTLYPAASPYVMSVGATKLNVDQAGNYGSEKAWSGTGGGISLFESEPLYQSAYPIPNNPTKMRGTPDVAYDGDPNTGVAVYSSVPGNTGWFQAGGTSIGPPQWSALVAIANSLRAKDNKPALALGQGLLYNPEVVEDSDGDMTFHDVSNGKDGNCGNQCRARPGYDYLTGLGTPRADLLIPALRGQ
jgi:subtilase family serine protease